MTRYNKSEIMKAAWNTFRANTTVAKRTRKLNNITTFAAALRCAWATAKAFAAPKADLTRTIGYVAARNLNVGDTIEVGTGLGYGFTAQKQITAIEQGDGQATGWLAIRFNDNKPAAYLPHNTVRRVAVAA
ncbi:MAG: hypothetical protein FWC16_00650 [Defluviitaleaceae bacterium]|nr:hypothetical protein [Defluviitaleaceae bacterium]MCL2273413.1 hypothetical protein [Defluviitaleaceae bacterium]